MLHTPEHLELLYACHHLQVRSSRDRISVIHCQTVHTYSSKQYLLPLVSYLYLSLNQELQYPF